MDSQVLRYMAMGYEIQPNGVVRDPYSGAEVDYLDLDGVSIPLVKHLNEGNNHA